MTTAPSATARSSAGGPRRRWPGPRDGAELRLAILLGAFAVAVMMSVVVFPTVTPFSTLLIPIVVGSLFLGPRTLPQFVLFVLAMLGISLLNQEELTTRTIGAAAVQVIIGGIVIVASRRRSRLGVAGSRGSMTTIMKYTLDSVYGQTTLFRIRSE